MKKWRERTHVVEDIGPALHGDALENGQHGEAEVVEICYPKVGPVPVLPANPNVVARVRVHVAAVVPLHPARVRVFHHVPFFSQKKKKKKNAIVIISSILAKKLTINKFRSD